MKWYYKNYEIILKYRRKKKSGGIIRFNLYVLRI